MEGSSLSYLTQARVEEWIRQAAEMWHPDIPVKFVPGIGNDTTIRVYVGSADWLQSIDCRDNRDFLTDDRQRVYRGFAITRTHGRIATHEIDGRNRDIRLASTAHFCLVDAYHRGGTHHGISYDARSAAGIQNTTTHELGHNLGFSGHPPSGGNGIMRAGTSNIVVVSPSANEIKHIKQFLEEYGR